MTLQKTDDPIRLVFFARLEAEHNIHHYMPRQRSQSIFAPRQDFRCLFVATLETNAATASARAAEIAAHQCHIPAAASSDGPAASGSIAEQFLAIKDPKAKAAFFKKNEKAILADHSFKA